MVKIYDEYAKWCESKRERRMRLEKLRMDEKVHDEYVKWSKRETLETQRRLQSVDEMVRVAMEQIPWNMMDKHLHSDEARKYHEETCNIIRSRFEKVPIIAKYKPFNRHIYIYAALKHRMTSSEDWSIAELMQEKLQLFYKKKQLLQLNGKFKTYGLLLGVGVGVGIGIGAAVTAAAFDGVGYAKVGTET